jgi:hypothetical protein
MAGRKAAGGAGVTVVLAAVSGALINELHGGWPWWVASAGVVLASAAVATWSALRDPNSGSAGKAVGDGAVSIDGHATAKNVKHVFRGPGSSEPQPADGGTGRGAFRVGGDLTVDGDFVTDIELTNPPEGSP